MTGEQNTHQLSEPLKVTLRTLAKLINKQVKNACGYERLSDSTAIEICETAQAIIQIIDATCLTQRKNTDDSGYIMACTFLRYDRD